MVLPLRKFLFLRLPYARLVCGVWGSKKGCRKVCVQRTERTAERKDFPRTIRGRGGGIPFLGQCHILSLLINILALDRLSSVFQWTYAEQKGSNNRNKLFHTRMKLYFLTYLHREAPQKNSSLNGRVIKEKNYFFLTFLKFCCHLKIKINLLY